MRANLVLLSVTLLFLGACEETKEGCLDNLAENLDFFAVNACDSCCTYPTFSLNSSWMIDTLDHNSSDTFLINGLNFQFNTIEILFSNFELLSIDNQYSILDSLIENGITVRDDYVFMDNDGRNSVGTTRFSDKLNEIKFSLGFNESSVSELKPFEDIDQNSNLDL